MSREPTQSNPQAASSQETAQLRTEQLPPDRPLQHQPGPQHWADDVPPVPLIPTSESDPVGICFQRLQSLLAQASSKCPELVEVSQARLIVDAFVAGRLWEKRQSFPQPPQRLSPPAPEPLSQRGYTQPPLNYATVARSGEARQPSSTVQAHRPTPIQMQDRAEKLKALKNLRA